MSSDPRPATMRGSALERARALAPLVAAAAPRIEAGRALPDDLLQALHGAALFRLALPSFLGGEALAPAELAAVMEIIAGADASTAWCVGQASGCAMSAAYLDEEAARRVFGPADAVLAWGAGAQGRALAVDGGFRITGRWGFASGARHATWLGAHCTVFEADGAPRLAADGTPVLRTALLPREHAQIVDDWYVVGLRGTRSEGYAVEDLFVEQALTLDRDTPGERRVAAPLYRFSTTQVYAGAFSGVALGIARACLDELLALAREKKPRGAGAMRDSAVVHTRLAELEACWGAARAFQQESLRAAWEGVVAGGDLTLDDRARIRLATTHAINEATRVTEQAYRLAGATAIFDSQPFERRFRDAYAVSQQVQGRHTHYETVGRHLLGVGGDTPFM